MQTTQERPRTPEAADDSGPAQALMVQHRVASVEELTLKTSPQPRPPARPGEAVVRVHSAAVNPSDVKATLGLMPHAVWPRVPGRDYAGVVVDGPVEWIGRAVWGTGGDLGISRDGTHARWLTLPVAALSAKPEALSMDEAGTVGVPFVTAYEGFRRSGMPRADQTVLVLGANGKVGQAAIQLAAAAGATVIGVQRRLEGAPAWQNERVHLVAAEDMPAQVHALTGGRGAHIIFNTVGSPYFEAANKLMAKQGVQIFIATKERDVPFDIFTFYRGMHTYVGVDTLALDCVACAAHLKAMAAGFETGALRPFPVRPEGTFALGEGLQAYRRALAGATERLLLKP